MTACGGPWRARQAAMWRWSVRNLDRLIPARVALPEEGKQGGRLQRRVPLELLTDPGPLVGEGVGTGDMGARLPQLAGQRPRPLVFPRRPLAHPRTGGSLGLRLAFRAFLHHSAYLRVVLHGTPLRMPCYLRRAVAPQSAILLIATGNSNGSPAKSIPLANCG